MAPATIIASQVSLILGIVVGWLAAERFIAFMDKTRHHYEELFEKNPHPEIFDEKGKINRSDYMSINFDLGYDPDDFDPEDIISEG